MKFFVDIQRTERVASDLGSDCKKSFDSIQPQSIVIPGKGEVFLRVSQRY